MLNRGLVPVGKAPLVDTDEGFVLTEVAVPDSIDRGVDSDRSVNEDVGLLSVRGTADSAEVSVVSTLVTSPELVTSETSVSRVLAVTDAVGVPESTDDKDAELISEGIAEYTEVGVDIATVGGFSEVVDDILIDVPDDVAVLVLDVGPKEVGI